MSNKEDLCYTCYETKDFCECSEGFDSTIDRELTGDFDSFGPKSLDEVYDNV